MGIDGALNIVSDRGGQRDDWVIIGGGIMGMAIALELRLRGESVTILSRSASEAAAQAAAGMLAPQAEGLAPGPMLDLCLASRELYPDWTRKLAALTGLDVGYWPCGILAPAYDQADFSHPAAAWQSRAAITPHQAGLSPAVQGGWWFPDDAQVDNRQLYAALQAAVGQLGVKVQSGVTSEALVTAGARVSHLQTSAGDWRADRQFILATGAWSQLLAVPVVPRKGQLLALRGPGPLPLTTVLFGSDIYLVPRRDGRIVVGATSETVGFTAGNTARGLQQLIAAATRLMPALQDFGVEETWWGFRPTTPDELPILGPSAWENLTLATGHGRNGILLTPITGQLIADWVLGSQRGQPSLAEPLPNPLLRRSRGQDPFLPPSPLEGEGLGVRSRENPHDPTHSRLAPFHGSRFASPSGYDRNSLIETCCDADSR
jgi:glycine oxidase ThiO